MLCHIKKCPKCGFRGVGKNGRFRGKQGYKCKQCGKQFVSKSRKSSVVQNIWHDYVWGKQSLNQIAKKYNKSIPYARTAIQKATVLKRTLPSRKVIVIADVTYFGRGYGILVVRSEKEKINLYWKEVTSEKPIHYQEARNELEQQGFALQAIVLDGRKGVREVFSDIPVQMCIFHQKAILRRYLTQNPKLQAGIELRALGETLTYIRKEDFVTLLFEWHGRWEVFLKERTYQEGGKHWHYTHRRIRSAYRSLKENIPYLFTYQKHSNLDIPKTTNSLDGTFGHMKTLLKNHRGVSRRRRFKMIEEILGK